MTGIDVQNRRGQNFITWNNLPGTGWTYHVYASASPIRTGAGFWSDAWELGTVGDSSAIDRRISKLLGQTLAFTIEDGAPPVDLHKGLFVTTPPEAPSFTHYVILAENATYPMDYRFYPGQNTTVDAVLEVPGVPRPIWQRTIAFPRVEDYVLFASPYDIPGMPAMWAKDNHARHFGVIPGKPGGALLMTGHGRGGSFIYSSWGTGHEGETVVSTDDYLDTGDVSSFYLGYNNSYNPDLGNNPLTSYGVVFDYTDRFVLYLMDWAKANYGSDPNRVYALGVSMGGSFAFFLAWHHPDRIAAALSIMPKACARFTGDAVPTISFTFSRMWSPVDVDLPLEDGTPVYDWMDGRSLAEKFERRGAPPVIGFVGRNDEIVGWQEKVELFKSLEQHRAGGTWYWDPRGHMDPATTVEWAPIQNDWAQLYAYRLDSSFPALSNCTANGDPGDGSTATGDSIGTLNGFVTWDPTFVDTRDRWECVLRPRSLQTLTGTLAPPADIHVDVTPRRLQNFLVSDRTAYRYTAQDAATGEVLASDVIEADSQYLLTVPSLPVRASGTRLVIQPLTSLSVGDGATPLVPRFALSANPVRGSARLQIEWPSEGDARVELMDLAGRRARTLFAAPARGATSLSLDTSGLAPGVYLLHARQGSLSNSTRVVVVR